MLLLSKICKADNIMPVAYLLRGEIHIGRVCHRSRFADVSKGEYSGSIVAIKRLRMNKEDYERVFKVPPVNSLRTRRSTFTQKLCREVIGWKRLAHPNILPLLGVCITASKNSFDILTEWMPSGDVVRYGKANPTENRLRLVSTLATSPHSVVR